MTDLLSSYYPWIKALHVVSVMSWMAGLFYLPRLFVYHVEGLQKRGVLRGSEMELLFRHQERLLLRAIMTPAMIATWVFGLALVFVPGVVPWGDVWPWVKGGAVFGMTGFHFWLAQQQKGFVLGAKPLTGRGYRLANEVPTVLMLIIVFSVFVRF